MFSISFSELVPSYRVSGSSLEYRLFIYHRIQDIGIDDIKRICINKDKHPSAKTTENLFSSCKRKNSFKYFKTVQILLFSVLLQIHYFWSFILNPSKLKPFLACIKIVAATGKYLFFCISLYIIIFSNYNN